MLVTIRLWTKANARAFAWVAKAVTTDPMGRLALEGIKVTHEDGYLKIAACDGFRLHEARIPNVKMMFTIEGLYKPELISVTKKIAVLSPIEAAFPNYESVYPKAGTPGTNIKVNKKFLAEFGAFMDSPTIRVHEMNKPATAEGTVDGIIFRALVMPMQPERKDHSKE